MPYIRTGMAAVLTALLAETGAGAQALCPAGARREGPRCVKDAASAWTPPHLAPAAPSGDPPPRAEACPSFKARLKAFHARRTAEYSALGRRHAALEDALREEAFDARRLEDELARAAARARDLALRRHLAAQSRAAGEAALSAEIRLRAVVRAHQEAEARFTDVYKIEARSLLASRPPGCALSAEP